jgi:CHAD domain-containing protein
VVVHHEVERTYQPAPDQPVPDLCGLPGVASIGPPRELELSATYFDTSDLALTRAGVSLRRRTGGADEGWHLKVPAETGRDEIRLPLALSRRTAPAALRRIVHGWTRDADLVVVATVVTHRTAYALLDDRGAELAELADDRVVAQPTGATTPVEWREWELELVAGGPDLLAAADEVLRASGVRPSPSQRKIVRALGGRLPAAPATGKLGPGKPAGRVLQARLAAQVAELLRRDSEVRRGRPEGVHQARVASRRIRAALATFRPLVDREVTDPIRAELHWLERALGPARDAHVVRDRLEELLDGEAPHAGAVRRRIDATYQDRARAAGDVLADVLASERYFALLDDLDRLVAAPPWTDAAARPASSRLRRRVRRDWRRLADRVTALEETREDRDAHDLAMHDVRKAAKRVRYALETVEPVWGRETEALHRAVKAITQVLGERQDTVVTRHDLEAIAVEATAAGENAIGYGRLHHREQILADEHDRRFEELWRAATGKKSAKKATDWLG